MKDYTLKFADEAEAMSVLFSSDAENQKQLYAAVDIIGTIYKPTGNMLTSEEGSFPEMAPVDGWHVNVRHTAEAPELDVYAVFPRNPVRMWA